MIQIYIVPTSIAHETLSSQWGVLGSNLISLVRQAFNINEADVSLTVAHPAIYTINEDDVQIEILYRHSEVNWDSAEPFGSSTVEQTVEPHS